MGVRECSEEERCFLDTAHGYALTGARWWEILEHHYAGTQYSNVHVFFYAHQQEAKPRAQFSAQLFPRLDMSPHLPMPDGLNRAMESLGLGPLRLNCLVVHSLASVPSFCYPPHRRDTFAAALQAGLEVLQRAHGVNIILVRGLHSGPGYLSEALDPRYWDPLPAVSCSRLQLESHSDLASYLDSLRSKQRRRLRSSQRKLARAPEISVRSIATPRELHDLLPQIVELKKSTGDRNQSDFYIPLVERESFYTRCMELYGHGAIFKVATDGMGRLLGACLTVESAGNARGFTMALRYPESKKYDLWYNLVLHTIDELCQRGVKTLHLGTGNHFIKSRLGGREYSATSAVSFYPNALRLLARKVVLPRIAQSP
jgi:hypothetical protein